MSDNNYSRMPDVGSDEVEVEEKDEMIFKDPKQIETSHEPKVSESADDKKERLKQHLARCRVKSAEVRAAKKAEKQANKKPRGRPKKLKEPLLPVVEEENQVVMQVKETSGIAKPDEPINKNFNMIDYQKLTDMIAAKMKPVAPVAPVAPKPPPQQKIVNNQEQMGNFLTQYTQAIRLQEQKKAKEQMAAARKEALHKNTKKYYGKLPPVNYFQSENNWDNIFNPK